MLWAIVIVLLLVVALAGVLFIGPYNSFVKMRNSIQESWRQIDVELNRRYELIPNLIETVRAYAAHERNTLEEITRLRNQAASMAHSPQGGAPTEQRSQIEEQLSGAVRNLIVSVEAYPDLKSNQNFLELQRELTDTEDRIAAGRRFYNANVRQYNTKVEQVPSNIVANMFHFEKATYFEVNDPAVRQAPNVNFGEISYRGDQPPAPSVAAGMGNQLPSQPSQPPAQFDQNQYQQQAPQQQYQAPQYQQATPPQGQPTQQYQAPEYQSHQPQQAPEYQNTEPGQAPHYQQSAPQPEPGADPQQGYQPPNYGNQQQG